MGLKTGMTFSSSIPAATVISMAMLRMLEQASILENNIVQTQASAAGTLCNVILVLPSLLHHRPMARVPVLADGAALPVGGMLGVMFSMPLRRTKESPEAVRMDAFPSLEADVAAAEPAASRRAGHQARLHMRRARNASAISMAT